MANEYTSKNSPLHGLLKDKNIYSIMREAVDSPVGSTSRKRAASMISVLKKTNLASGADTMSYGIFDGKGGPGIDPTQATTSTPQPSQDYSNFRVLPAAPAMNSTKSWKDMITEEQKGALAPAGIYQHGAIVKGGAALQEGVASAGEWLGSTAGPAALKSAATPGAIALGTAEYGAKGAVRNIGMLRDWAFGSKPGEEWSSMSNDFSKTYGGEQLGAMWGGSTLDKLRQSSIAKGKQMGLNQGGTASGAEAEVSKDTTVQTGEDAGSKTGAQTGSTPSVPGTIPTYSGGTVDRAVAQGVGPSMFALRAMSDPQGFKKLMKEQAGFDIADEDLPTGGSLSSNIDKIEKTLKLQYNLDGLLNEKNSIVETGITVERDLKDYIRGRDEYLTETQRMIEGAEKDMWSQNLGDPQVAKQHDNYMNYLYTLRGNQNKRYVDFLNSGITQYNKDLTEVTNNYDKALSAYQHDLTTKAAITTEEFNMYNTALQEMYTNAENAPMKKLQMQALYNQVYPATTSTITDAAGNVINSGDYAKDVGIVSKMGAGARLIEEMDFNGRKIAVLSPDMTSIQQEINDLSGSVSSPHSVMRMIKSGMQGSLETTNGLKETTSMGEKFMGMIKEKLDMAADEQTQQEAVNLAGEIAPTLSRSVSAGIKKDPNALSSITGATKHIASPGWFGLRKVPTKQEAINKFPEVDPEVLNALYSMISQYKQDNGMSAASTNDILVGTKTRGQQKISNLTPEEVADFVGEAMGANMYRAIFPQ